MPHAIIFDLDGTLVESLPGIATALNRALTARGLPTHGEAAVRTFIGNGSWTLCRRGAPDEPDSAIDALEKLFFEEYATAWRDGTHPYPGIMDLLNALAADKIPLGIFSNKPHTFTAEIVTELFPALPWCAVLGHQPNTPRKPDPFGALQVASSIDLPPSDILFVGDSTVDYETAVNAGMQPLLVDWGYHDRTALENTGAPIVSSANQILPALAAPRPGA